MASQPYAHHETLVGITIAQRRSVDADPQVMRLRILACLFVLLFAGCVVPGGNDPHPADTKAKNDLTQALADMNTYYAGHGIYTTYIPALRAIDSTIDWGGKLTMVVADAQDAGDGSVACLTERSTSGTVFNIANVARGANAGTYKNKDSDCADPFPPVLAGPWNTGWGDGGDAETKAQNDLTQGLLVEQQYSQNNGGYTPTTSDLRAIDSALDWGGTLRVFVGDAQDAGDHAVACLCERSTTGTAFNIANVARGADAGTYKNKGGDCSDLVPATLSGVWNTGW
jgi:hypothetical protein